MGRIEKKPPTRRDAEDRVRLKTAGVPAHINPREDDFLKRALPEMAGKVVKSGLLAEAGVRGDDRVTKLTARERAMLKARGGSGTRNPATGLLQYYGDGSADDSSHGTGVGPSGESGLGDAAQGNNSGSGGNNTYSGDWSGGMSLGYAAPYDPTTMPSIESILNTPNGYRAEGYEGLSMRQYSPPDTFGRLLDTYRYGPPPSYTARGKVPGGLGMPNSLGPGIVGKAVANFGGPMMSGLMNLGTHMDQAMSPESRAASLAENAAQGAKNSTGRDPVSGMTREDMARATPGATSGAETAKLVPPAGYTVNAAGQIVPAQGGNNRPAYQDPIRNLLYDYIIRGR